MHIDTLVQTCTQSYTDVLVSFWYFLVFSRGHKFSCSPLFLFPRSWFYMLVGMLVPCHWDFTKKTRARANSISHIHKNGSLFGSTKDPGTFRAHVQRRRAFSQQQQQNRYHYDHTRAASTKLAWFLLHLRHFTPPKQKMAVLRSGQAQQLQQLCRMLPLALC